MVSNLATIRAVGDVTDDPLWDENELSAFTKKSPRTYQAMRVHGGGPKYIKLGAHVRYRRSDVFAWLAANVRESTSDEGGGQ
jgi:hypothetical protein